MVCCVNWYPNFSFIYIFFLGRFYVREKKSDCAHLFVGVVSLLFPSLCISTSFLCLSASIVFSMKGIYIKYSYISQLDFKHPKCKIMIIIMISNCRCFITAHLSPVCWNCGRPYPMNIHYTVKPGHRNKHTVHRNLLVKTCICISYR